MGSFAGLGSPGGPNVCVKKHKENIACVCVCACACSTGAKACVSPHRCVANCLPSARATRLPSQPGRPGPHAAEQPPGLRATPAAGAGRGGGAHGPLPGPRPTMPPSSPLLCVCPLNVLSRLCLPMFVLLVKTRTPNPRPPNSLPLT